MIGGLVGLEDDLVDVGQVSSARLLVDGTLVHARVGATRAVDGEDVDDGHRLEKNFGFGLDELALSAVPACPLQVESVDVDALLWR